jgi:3-oxoacyl-[acyl-carrier protein] reductase
MQLRDRIAIVTGGTQGIGRRIAEGLLAEGARVLVAARTVDGITLPEAPHGAVAARRVDVRDPDSVAAMVDTAHDRFGGLDILVANAGISRPGPLALQPVEVWRDVIDTNVTGVLQCVQAAVPLLEKSPAGRVITLSSVLAGRPTANAGSYCASKAAVEALTRVYALELADRGITVNCLSPGYIAEGMGERLTENTAIWSVVEPKLASGRLGTGAEVAGAAVFLAGASSSYISGHVLEVNGGLRH